MRVLWVDDDSYGLLQPLYRMLERKGGLSVKRATNFKDAAKFLKDAYPALNTRYGSLLVDIILPEAQGGGSLASDLGIKLAELSAVSYGIKSVAFLTVVRQDEVVDKYVELEGNYPDVQFSYFDKTALLSRGEIEMLIERLGGHGQEVNKNGS